MHHKSELLSSVGGQLTGSANYAELKRPNPDSYPPPGGLGARIGQNSNSNNRLNQQPTGMNIRARPPIGGPSYPVPVDSNGRDPSSKLFNTHSTSRRASESREHLPGGLLSPSRFSSNPSASLPRPAANGSRASTPQATPAPSGYYGQAPAVVSGYTAPYGRRAGADVTPTMASIGPSGAARGDVSVGPAGRTNVFGMPNASYPTLPSQGAGHTTAGQHAPRLSDTLDQMTTASAAAALGAAGVRPGKSVPSGHYYRSVVGPPTGPSVQSSGAANHGYAGATGGPQGITTLSGGVGHRMGGAGAASLDMNAMALLDSLSKPHYGTSGGQPGGAYPGTVGAGAGGYPFSAGNAAAGAGNFFNTTDTLHLSLGEGGDSHAQHHHHHHHGPGAAAGSGSYGATGTTGMGGYHASVGGVASLPPGRQQYQQTSHQSKAPHTTAATAGAHMTGGGSGVVSNQSNALAPAVVIGTGSKIAPFHNTNGTLGGGRGGQQVLHVVGVTGRPYLPTDYPNSDHLSAQGVLRSLPLSSSAFLVQQIVIRPPGGGHPLTLQVEIAWEENRKFRDYMEDGHILEAVPGTEDEHLLGVMDGHGGRAAVNFITRNFDAVFAQEAAKPIPQSQTHLQNASLCRSSVLDRTFLRIDEQLKVAGCFYEGCTATIASMKAIQGPNGLGLQLCVAGVGDSRALIIQKTGEPARMAYDHKATDPQELVRIHEDGGRVLKNRVGGSLAVARAMGDFSLKDVGVSACPSLYSRDMLGHKDRLVIIASDGVWDVVDDREASQIAMAVCSARWAAKNPTRVPGGEAAAAKAIAGGLGDEKRAVIAQKIVSLALSRGSRDNITCMVVRMPNGLDVDP